MDKFIELYGEEESEETSTVSTKEAKEKIIDLEKYPTMEMKAKKIPTEEAKEKIIDLEKYPTMEMEAKKTRYKLVLD